MEYQRKHYNKVHCGRCGGVLGLTFGREVPRMFHDEPACYALGPEPTAARNAAIVDAYRAGKAATKIAADYGISRQRVLQIVRRERQAAEAILEEYGRRQQRRGRPPAEVVWARDFLGR